MGNDVPNNGAPNMLLRVSPRSCYSRGPEPINRYFEYRPITALAPRPSVVPIHRGFLDPSSQADCQLRHAARSQQKRLCGAAPGLRYRETPIGCCGLPAPELTSPPVLVADALSQFPQTSAARSNLRIRVSVSRAGMATFEVAIVTSGRNPVVVER
jgi:hypothetical protein